MALDYFPSLLRPFRCKRDRNPTNNLISVFAEVSCGANICALRKSNRGQGVICGLRDGVLLFRTPTFGRRKLNKHRVPFAVSLTIIIVTIMVVLVHFWFYCDESVSRDLRFQCLTWSIGRDEGPLACRKISF